MPLRRWRYPSTLRPWIRQRVRCPSRAFTVSVFRSSFPAVGLPAIRLCRRSGFPGRALGLELAEDLFEDLVARALLFGVGAGRHHLEQFTEGKPLEPRVEFRRE